MKYSKAECERAIRGLVRKWANLKGILPGSAEMPCYSEFRSWVNGQGYSHYLDFRSVAGPSYDAEQWFDEELKQTWRN